MRWLTSQPANQQVFAYTSPLICYRQSSHVIALQSSTVTILYATEKQPKYRANIIFVLLLFFFYRKQKFTVFWCVRSKKVFGIYFVCIQIRTDLTARKSRKTVRHPKVTNNIKSKNFPSNRTQIDWVLFDKANYYGRSNKSRWNKCTKVRFQIQVIYKLDNHCFVSFSSFNSFCVYRSNIPQAVFWYFHNQLKTLLDNSI